MGMKREKSPREILFGLNREEDERSLADFLQLFSRDELSSVLIPRMTDREIQHVVDLLSDIMRKHLTKKEYHSLFLADPDNSH